MGQIIIKGKNNNYPTSETLPDLSLIPDRSQPYSEIMMRCMGKDWNNGYPYVIGLPDIEQRLTGYVYFPVDFYNNYNINYIKALKQERRTYKIKLELLDYWEGTIGEITKDVSISALGQININYQQGIRRSCSLTLINVEKKYQPSENSRFWYNKKFKLYIGVVYKQDTYWWSQGVFVTQNATGTNGVVNIEAVDKFALLDGTIKTGMVEREYVVESGTDIYNVILDTLVINTGNNRPLDPITPMVDVKFNNKVLQEDISLTEGSYIGELLIQLGDNYSADVYYDNTGKLIFSTLSDASRMSGYNYLAHQWDFKDNTALYCDVNTTYGFDGINCVTVNADTSLESASYTAYNKNPQSPLNIHSVGLRRLESQDITYVNVTQDEMEDLCRQHAQYLLFKHSIMGMSKTFTTPIIPHLDVNKTIGIEDIDDNKNIQTYIVQSISIPLGAGKMNVTACNLQWLPDDSEIG